MLHVHLPACGASAHPRDAAGGGEPRGAAHGKEATAAGAHLSSTENKGLAERWFHECRGNVKNESGQGRVRVCEASITMAVRGEHWFVKLVK